MPFKQLVRAAVADGLEETYRFETWRAGFPGRAYFDVHCSVIEERETAAPTLLAELGRPPKRVLESGCGSGRWMAFLERAGCKTYGIDWSAGALATAKSHAPELRLVRADVRRAPFRDETFGAVISAYVAEHFEEGPALLLREIHRILRPGGLLLLTVPYTNLFRRLVVHPALGAFYAWCRLRRVPLAFAEYRFGRTEIRKYVEGAGFRIRRLEPDDFRLPWAKGLAVDLGPLVLARPEDPGSWELSGFGLALARALSALSPWARAAGVLVVAERSR